MESRRAVQVVGAVFCVLLIVSEICCFPPPLPLDDYEQGREAHDLTRLEKAKYGLREIMEELDRQGYTGPLEPRSYNPDRKMMRKSQRSSNLRLRFGKRSISPLELESIRNANWKVGGDVQRED